MSPKRNPNRLRTKFGAYLVNLRIQNTGLSTSAASLRLGLRGRQQLDHYEIGRTVPSLLILIRLAELYKVPREEVIARAYWPQLILLPITALIEPDQLPDDLVEEIEKGLEESERRELTEFIESLLRRRLVLRQR